MARKKPAPEELPEPPPIPTVMKCVNDLAPGDKIVLNNRAFPVVAWSRSLTKGWSVRGGKCGSYENPQIVDSVWVVYLINEGGEVTAIHKQKYGSMCNILAPDSEPMVRSEHGTQQEV